KVLKAYLEKLAHLFFVIIAFVKRILAMMVPIAFLSAFPSPQKQTAAMRF
ncbi:hypothetical protein HRG84_23820, partial [Flavisolibacter sp. BT320]|nr:hypothetical protein [Flavisolibacter longurius]